MYYIEYTRLVVDTKNVDEKNQSITVVEVPDTIKSLKEEDTNLTEILQDIHKYLEYHYAYVSVYKNDFYVLTYSNRSLMKSEMSKKYGLEIKFTGAQTDIH